MEFVGSPTCYLVPNGPIWRSDISIECLVVTNEVLDSRVRDFLPKELGRNLNDAAVLSPMFQVEGTINNSIHIDVMVGKRFSARDGWWIISRVCRGNISMRHRFDVRCCRSVIFCDNFCWKGQSRECRCSDGGAIVGGSSAGMVGLGLIFSTVDRRSAEVISIIVVERSFVRR